MSSTNDEKDVMETVRKETKELDLRMEIDSLGEEIKILKGQLRSMEYTSNLEREAYKILQEFQETLASKMRRP